MPDIEDVLADARREIKSIGAGRRFRCHKIDLEEIKSYCKAFPVYLRKDDKGLQGAEVKAMNVGSDPDGGYMVTPAIGSIINGVQFETSPMRAIANIETISSDAIEYPRDDDEAAAGWVGEQEDRPETGTPKVGMRRGASGAARTAS